MGPPRSREPHVLVRCPDESRVPVSNATLLLDVRLPQEIKRRGFIAGSKPVPRQVVEWWADPESPYFRPDGEFGVFDRRLITYCDEGDNGALTAATLQDLGYTNVATVEGGFFGMLAKGLLIVDPPD